jgi:hypothetical protein
MIDLLSTTGSRKEVKKLSLWFSWNSLILSCALLRSSNLNILLNAGPQVHCDIYSSFCLKDSVILEVIHMTVEIELAWISSYFCWLFILY